LAIIFGRERFIPLLIIVRNMSKKIINLYGLSRPNRLGFLIRCPESGAPLGELFSII
jgi:hypothetical protein